MFQLYDLPALTAFGRPLLVRRGIWFPRTPAYTGEAMRLFQVVTVGVVIAATMLALLYRQELANILRPLLYSLR